jgi:hypothetical protein
MRRRKRKVNALSIEAVARISRISFHPILQPSADPWNVS